MRSLDAQMAGAIVQERLRAASRRDVLIGSAKIAGGGVLALAFAAAPLSRNPHVVLAQEFEDDLDILNFALTLEHLEHALYREALERFDEDDFEDDTIRSSLEAIRDHEAEHVAFLTQAIEDAGGTPVEEAERYAFGYENLDGFLAIAATLEEVGVAAYAGAAPQIVDPEFLAATVSIHSVEARHSAYLNWRNETSPFPEAFDSPLAPADVLTVATPFLLDGIAEATPDS